MARHALVVDASVGVKWFSAVGEPNVPEARAILMGCVSGRLDLVVPELFFHEIGNALVHKASISDEQLEEALAELCDLDLGLFSTNGDRLVAAVQLARRAGISEYDAYYIVAASENGCPLVTANPRHQKPGLGCRVIPIEQWQEGAIIPE
ncbi:MAG: type II toxin-antitoxin system VapC family toxin [Dehalococcoidia bacterium]|nr:type II toxin-antitoxin system VapC family toxin [Dehalococcoidia bacterium]